MQLSPLFESAKMTLESESVVLSTEALDLSVKTRNIPNHRWDFTIKTVQMNEDEGFQLYAELLTLQGGKPFTVVLPLKAQPNGAATGSPVSRLAKLAGTSTIEVDNFGANVAGIIRAGDIFKLSGHDKVYMATATANTNGTGQTTLSFYPALKKSVAANEPLLFHNVAMTVVAPSRTRRFEIDAETGQQVRFELDCKEY